METTDDLPWRVSFSREAEDRRLVFSEIEEMFCMVESCIEGFILKTDGVKSLSAMCCELVGSKREEVIVEGGDGIQTDSEEE